MRKAVLLAEHEGLTFSLSDTCCPLDGSLITHGGDILDARDHVIGQTAFCANGHQLARGDFAQRMPDAAPWHVWKID